MAGNVSFSAAFWACGRGGPVAAPPRCVGACLPGFLLTPSMAAKAGSLSGILPFATLGLLSGAVTGSCPPLQTCPHASRRRPGRPWRPQENRPVANCHPAQPCSSMQERTAKSQEPGAGSEEPRAKSQEPRAKSREQRADSTESRARARCIALADAGATACASARAELRQQTCRGKPRSPRTSPQQTRTAVPAARAEDRGGDVMRGVMSEVEDRSPQRPAFAAMDGVSKKPGRHDPPHRGAARRYTTERRVLQNAKSPPGCRVRRGGCRGCGRTPWPASRCGT